MTARRTSEGQAGAPCRGPVIALISRLVREDEGQDLVEYAALIALVALIATVGVQAFGDDVAAFFDGLGGGDSPPEPPSGDGDQSGSGDGSGGPGSGGGSGGDIESPSDGPLDPPDDDDDD